MAGPRKVPFVTLSAFATVPAPEPKKRRKEDEIETTLEHGKPGTAETGAGGGGGALFGNVKVGGGDTGEPSGITVRLNLCLSEPSDQASAEFSYSELVQSRQVKRHPPQGLTPACDPNDPLADEQRERREVEALARKFESKYGNSVKKKRKDRMQDLIDIGFGYDESDSFIDNSEAYDELVPASLNTKLGGFYINTGTLHFRAASESEGEEGGKAEKLHKRMKDGEERVIKKRKKKEGVSLEEKKPKKNRPPKPGALGLSSHRPEKKKRKKLMKDSLHLAAILRRFTPESAEHRKKNLSTANSRGPAHPAPPPGVATPHGPRPAFGPAHADISMSELTADPAVMSLLGSANESEMLQDLMGELDFGVLDSPQACSPAQGENGLVGAGAGQKAGSGVLGKAQATSLLVPPPLPDNLPAPLLKRIDDLRLASRQFDQEGRKKFFTLDMNSILLDIELQVQEQPAAVRSAVYSHLEAFVPCNKEVLLKRLKKLSLNVQDDRLRAPLLKLKLAVCSVMPEQITRYNMDCIARVAKQQSEEVEKNGSEEDDEEKPGKRVMGPRKKFLWDDKLRTLLCSVVRVKLGCYELESQCSLSVEDYLKAFLETEVKPLWPKGWMQARILFKESRSVHSHLTDNPVKKKMVPAPKSKPKEGAWVQKPSPSPASVPTACRPAPSSPETICLSDSPDDDLPPPSPDSISHALALLSSAAKGLIQDRPASPKPSHPPPPAGKKAAPSVGSSPAPRPVSSPVAFGAPKGGAPLSQAQRHPQAHARQPAFPALNKLQSSSPPLPPKPRPPPTSSPLVPPQQKAFSSPGVKQGMRPVLSTPPSGLDKGSGKASSSSNGSMGVPPQCRSSALPSPQPSPSVPQTSRPHQTPHLRTPPQASPTSSPSPSASPGPAPVPSPSSQAKPHQQQQSSFITPMQVTLSKSSHSSNPSIIKLSPRPPAPAPPSSSSSSSPSLPSHSHPQSIPNLHLHSSKSSAVRPPFPVPGGGAKSGQGGYGTPGGQKAVSQGNGNTSTSLPSTSSTPGRPVSSPSPVASPTNHEQRQRTVGGASPGTKPVVSRAPAPTPPSLPVTSQLSQISSAGSSLLGTPPPSLPLGFGMLGGLVPVSLPFQFPSLLNFTPPTGPTGGSAGSEGATATGNNSGYGLAQNLYKSLQSGPLSALPPHLQLAFSDVNQSQEGDTNRKAL
ncbi:ubinuclein-2-like isoform X1 [Anguilla anguilla]|uniref:ubinuclein-2-like isoform X1 n=1 Tax=Anguilla anguilla TaxID=7936 RepID=UPI0015B1DCC0|nr:ubinuclein-2-like isoform X1 [Anguilla anguilla]